MISFVYFDLGGVVILDFSGTNKWEEMKRDLGIEEKTDAAFSNIWRRYHSEFCISRHVDTLIPIFKQEIGISFPFGYSMLMDFVNRFDPNPSIWSAINTIRQSCMVGILTNAYPKMFQAIQKSGILPPIEWNVIVDSSVVGCQKPDRHIFEIAERQSNVNKDEILFVENGEDNIKAAREFGWQTFFYDSIHPKESSKELVALFNSNMVQRN